jgi:hypothetical protein
VRRVRGVRGVRRRRRRIVAAGGRIIAAGRRAGVGGRHGKRASHKESSDCEELHYGEMVVKCFWIAVMALFVKEIGADREKLNTEKEDSSSILIVDTTLCQGSTECLSVLLSISR